MDAAAVILNAATAGLLAPERRRGDPERPAQANTRCCQSTPTKTRAERGVSPGWEPAGGPSIHSPDEI